MTICTVCGGTVSYDERLPLGAPLSPINQSRLALHLRCASVLTSALASAFADALGDHGIIPMAPCDTLGVALSRRESQILSGICRGRSNREIAGELGLAEKTIKNYCRTLYSKLGARDRTEAAVIGLRRGLVPQLWQSA